MDWLDGYLKNGKLTKAGYVGLRRELHFYHRFRDEYRLTVAADVGDHCDFTGLYGQSRPIRIDVTSDVGVKMDALDDFVPYLDNHDYVVVEIKGDYSDPVFYPSSLEATPRFSQFQ